jgi:hypothetical protein
LGRGWATLTGPLGIVANRVSQAATPLGLVPWAKAAPALWHRFLIFLFSFTFSKNRIKFKNAYKI